MRRPLCRLVSLIAVLSGAAGPVVAQEVSAERQVVFTQYRLSIEVAGQAMGSANYSTGLVTASSWTKWTAREGFRVISEENFFRKVGMLREAEEARAYRAKGDKYFRIGKWMTLGGLAVLLGGINDESGLIPTTGALVSVAGLFPLYAGVGYATTNWAPVSSVEHLVAPYNERLRERIERGQFKP